MNPVDVIEGDGPVILAMPHTGLHVPGSVMETLNETGRRLADTDWHIDKLYKGLLPDATVVRAMFHRYLIDANRDPYGHSLYPGQNTTGLCPVTDFEGRPIYCKGEEPESAEIESRRGSFHVPYHEALSAQIKRLRKRFGVVILYDCHSIRSNIPYLFDGQLPDFNIGTNEGVTCAVEIEKAVCEICSGADGFTWVANGRFKGGWTTRHYGRPHDGIHAIQMELAQNTYLGSECEPFDYDQTRAARLIPHLQKVLVTLEGVALELSKRDLS